MDAVANQLKRFCLGHRRIPLDKGKKSEPEKCGLCHQPSGGSVVPAIDGFNSLFRFVQQSGRRCNTHLPRREVDRRYHVGDRRDQQFTTWPRYHVDVGGA